jgi:hypothetical protein
VKRSGRDEPIWVAIHKCMEATLGIFLYSYLHLKLAKMLCLSYYLLCFLFNKIREQGGRTGSAQNGGEWPKQCTHMWVNVKTIKYRRGREQCNNGVLHIYTDVHIYPMLWFKMIMHLYVKHTSLIWWKLSLAESIWKLYYIRYFVFPKWRYKNSRLEFVHNLVLVPELKV